MAKQGFKILDSDMHVMEPPDLWERYIDTKYKSQAPRGVISDNVRDLRMVYPDGRDWARKTIRQKGSEPGHNFERNQKLYRSYAERGWTAEVQIEVQAFRDLPWRRSGRLRHRDRPQLEATARSGGGEVSESLSVGRKRNARDHPMVCDEFLQLPSCRNIPKRHTSAAISSYQDTPAEGKAASIGVLL